MAEREHRRPERRDHPDAPGNCESRSQLAHPNAKRGEQVGAEHQTNPRQRVHIPSGPDLFFNAAGVEHFRPLVLSGRCDFVPAMVRVFVSDGCAFGFAVNPVWLSGAVRTCGFPLRLLASEISQLSNCHRSLLVLRRARAVAPRCARGICVSAPTRPNLRLLRWRAAPPHTRCRRWPRPSAWRSRGRWRSG